jgi:beta-aspartyl-peptidase (threonine type)
MGGSGAIEFAHELGLEFADDDYFFDESSYQQLLEAREQQRIQLDHSHTMGTVGAVALDRQGDLAAATSTGGMTNKRFGRIGDSPVIGAGTYANNSTCAVSCTGHGEFILRGVSAYDLSCLMEYGGMDLQSAGRRVIDKLGALGGGGGLIAIDRHGNVSLPFNTEGMYRGWISEGSEASSAIFSNPSL